MTLDRVLLNLSHKEHSPGLCYVAVSRALRLQGIMLQETVDLSHLQRIDSGPSTVCVRLTTIADNCNTSLRYRPKNLPFDHWANVV